MKNKWIKRGLIAGGLSLLAVGSSITLSTIVTKTETRDYKRDTHVSTSQQYGTELGIIHVSNVYELQNAIRTASDYDTIVLRAIGSPYNLSELPCMHTNGYLYVTNSITIRGDTGNPNDVVIEGNSGEGITTSSNRIFFVKAEGCKFDNITIANGICSTNTLQKYGGGIHWGAGIYLGLATNDCRISNCIFRGNIAQRGGAIACSRSDDVSTKVNGCSFVANIAYEAGGAIYNGGTIASCSFTRNDSYKNGGAVYRGTLTNCIGSENWAQTKGCELYDCKATGYRYSGECRSDTASRFNDVLLDRSRLTVTNGLLFSGWFDVRSSVIANGTNFILSASLKTNEVSSLINCTVADNKNYQLVKPDVKTYGNLAVLNCIFSENTSTAEWGTKVNLNFVTNRYNKSVAMTKAQRYLAFGWNGDVNADAAQTNVNVHAGETIDIVAEIYLDTTLISQSINSEYAPSRSEDVTVSYRQFYHANGWNGDETLPSFVAKSDTYSIGKDNQKTYNNLMSAYSTNLTWATYYTNMGWNGSSVYTGYASGLFDFSLSVSNMLNIIQGSYFTFSHLEEEENPRWAYGDWIYGCNYFSDAYPPTSFDFIDDKNYPYLISQESIAYHDIAITSGIIATNFSWMASALDLRGVPRLYGGGLDIGAYQAIEYRKPTRFIIRIR